MEFESTAYRWCGRQTDISRDRQVIANRHDCSGVGAIGLKCNRRTSMTRKLKFLVAAGTVSAAMMSASSAFAAGSLVGTDVQNQVTVDFQVGGVNQTQQTATDTFDVDRKLAFTVAEKAAIGTTTVSPAQNDAIVAYTVTNASNDILDFALTATNLSGGAAPRGTDNIDASNLEICVDADDNGSCSGTGAETWGATGVIDNLGADVIRTVFVRGDFASNVTNGQIAGVSLNATAHVGGGAGLGTLYSTSATAGTPEFVATDSTANTAGVETIFADTGRNGVESALDDYTVGAAVLSVVKSSTVLWDPVTGSSNGTTIFAKAIPGAIVQYCIAVTNGAGAAVAQSVAISDALGGKPFTYYGTTIASGPPTIPTASANPISATACDGTGTNADATALTYNSGTNTVSGNLGDIAASTTETLIFRVVLN
jgi:hypothetical protein